MVRVVITMEGGLIQHIMADTKDVQVFVLDFDTEGGDDERSGNSRETRCTSSRGWMTWTRRGSMKSKQPYLNKTFTLSLSPGIKIPGLR